ncbi:MAG: dimethylargininase [Gemmatimonadetes bacterium]|nr:dimethylargininase [Gemmatimonadota bacterium]
MISALTRAVPPSITRCELTHLARQPIDLQLADEQHRRYEQALAALGCAIRRLPPEPELPDSVFVEDTAVVLPELAIMARPGVASRRAEVASVAAVLGEQRPLAFIEAPGTLEGGDVLRLGSRIFIGRSGRTNDEGIGQVRALGARFGYTVEAVDLAGCLHLKSAVTAVAEGAVLLNPAWIDAGVFARFERIEVHPEEPWAANVLWHGEGVLCAAAYPRTRERLEQRGLRVQELDVSELAKAEAGLTCCSLLLAG